MSAHILNLQKTLEQYPHAELMLVTKGKSLEQVREVEKNVQFKCVGENRLSEIREKYVDTSCFDIVYIGPMQSKDISALLKLKIRLGTLSSRKHIEKMHRYFEANGLIEKMPSWRFQIRYSDDERGGGITMEDVHELISQKPDSFNRCEGLTFMPPNVEKQARQKYFSWCRKQFDSLGKDIGEHFRICSMGMSGDYDVALAEGATEIRVGRLLFEEIL